MINSKIKIQKSKCLKRKSQSAALIIALLIVTVASIMILGTTRSIVTSTFTSNRYGDAVTANNLAWSGIEEGLMRLKTSTSLITKWPSALLYYDNRDRVVRRNYNPAVAGQDFIDDTDGEPVNQGIDFRREITDTSPLTYDWRMNNYYNDLRVSTIDVILSTVNNKYGVNIGAGDVVLDTSFYTIAKKDEISGYAWRIFDASQIKFISGTNSDRFINFLYKTSGSGTASVTFYAHYTTPNGVERHPASSPGYGTHPEDGMQCWQDFADPIWDWFTCVPATDCPGNARNSFLKNFWVSGPYSITAGTTSSQRIYIPFSCDGAYGIGSATGPDYIAMRVSFTDPSYKLKFGLTQTSNASGDSYPGLGGAKIISTGIFSNIRKTIEVWATKNVFADTSQNDPIQQLRCTNVSTNDLTKCSIKVYRDTKY